MKYSSEADTLKHIRSVAAYLIRASVALLERAAVHDETKLEDPEKAYFDKFTPALRDISYGNSEYFKILRGLKPALEHHYAACRHHPEHHKDGIDDMNLIDLVEMVCDWKAASGRHKDGDVFKSLKKNVERFGISAQLEAILYNTLKVMEIWEQKK